MRRVKQQGISLISTMIGMTIAALSVTGMIAAYKSTLVTVVPVARDAETDGQRLGSLLRANMRLQGAGFGISSPTFAADMVVLSGAALSGTNLSGASETGSPAAGNAVVWGLDTGGGYTCEGLYAPATGGLQHLLPTTCSAASQFSSLNWSAQTMVDDVRQVQITTTAESCHPYGVAKGTTGAAEGNRTVALSTTMSTQQTSGAIPVTVTTCLANYLPAS
jgi:hypothetical protein